MSGYYEYYSGFCVCGNERVVLPMKDLNGNDVYTFPVQAYNVNVAAIGAANNKDEYIAVWNSDPANQAIGILSGAVGPFLFTLAVNPGQVIPPWVIGDPGEIDYGIYEEEYAIEYE